MPNLDLRTDRRNSKHIQSPETSKKGKKNQKGWEIIETDAKKLDWLKI